MYIFITPKGKVTRKNSITFGELKRSDRGQYQILDVASITPKEYIKGEWYNINIQQKTN